MLDYGKPTLNAPLSLFLPQHSFVRWMATYNEQRIRNVLNLSCVCDVFFVVVFVVVAVSSFFFIHPSVLLCETNVTTAALYLCRLVVRWRLASATYTVQCLIMEWIYVVSLKKIEYAPIFNIMPAWKFVAIIATYGKTETKCNNVTTATGISLIRWKPVYTFNFNNKWSTISQFSYIRYCIKFEWKVKYSFLYGGMNIYGCLGMGASLHLWHILCRLPPLSLDHHSYTFLRGRYDFTEHSFVWMDFIYCIPKDLCDLISFAISILTLKK